MVPTVPSFLLVHQKTKLWCSLYTVELHVHLDGAVRPQTIFDIAKSRGLQMPHDNIEDFKKDVVVYEPTSLEELLKCFNIFMPIIAGSRDALRRIAYEFCEDCAEHGIKYVETRYAPHLFANNSEKPIFAPDKGDLSPREVVSTICQALQKGSRDFNITAKSILCCMEHTPEWSLEVAELCKEFKSEGVVAIDIAGDDFTPGAEPDECLHKQAFKVAYESGIHRTVHAGENGPAEGIKEALDHMYAERIGHGYHVFEDEELYQRCLKERVHFEVCPESSIKTGSVPTDLSRHPIIRFAADGANFSINTDDPIVLDNDIDVDYRLVKKMGLTDEQIIQSVRFTVFASNATCVRVRYNRKCHVELYPCYFNRHCSASFANKKKTSYALGRGICGFCPI